MISLIRGDARRIALADSSVHCVITSPPYFGLRDYGTGVWAGGDANCDHCHYRESKRSGLRKDGRKHEGLYENEKVLKIAIPYKRYCQKCGAYRVDIQLGTEELHDCLAWARGEPPCGECYVCNVRVWAKEIYRILRPDGVFWLNLGDSYNGSGGAGGDYQKGGNREGQVGYRGRNIKTLKPKDLCGIPARVVLALQSDGWYWRAEIIWWKPNAMPENAPDRPSRDHEMVYMLTKRKKIFFDRIAIQEEAVIDRRKMTSEPSTKIQKALVPGNRPQSLHKKGGARWIADENGKLMRMKRTVWRIPTRPFKGPHYATFPENLVVPMILSSTSAVGVCPKCGNQWERVTKRTKINRDIEKEREEYMQKTGRTDGKVPGPGGKVDTVVTVGWRATCTCDAGTPIPATVFDPFSGTATVGVVCERLRRSFVGNELSVESINLAKQRLKSLPLLALIKGE